MVLSTLLFLAFLSLFPNLWMYPFKNEESLRVIVAFEMAWSANVFQPTLLGEFYYNKPPLFNWLILLYSHLIPWSEMTVRAVSLTALTLSTIVVFLFARGLLQSVEKSLLASLIFLTFGNVFFFYGYLGEIDITLTFFVSLMFLLLHRYHVEGRGYLIITAGLVCGFAFLLKGFPAYAFFFISLVALALYKKEIRFLFSRYAVLSYFLSLFLPLLWVVNTHDPVLYIQTLFNESFSRVSSEDFNRLRHALFFLLLTIKDTLPWSLVFLLSVYLLKRSNSLNFPKELHFPTLLFVLNYIPYMLSNSAGRYILPLYPLLAVIFTYYIGNVGYIRFRRFIYLLVLLIVLLRALYGTFFFPFYANRENSPKRIAQDIYAIVQDKPVACDCIQHKSVCLYLGIFKGAPLKTSRL